MVGKLIRCLCGNMFDPDTNETCPACGRSTTPAAPKVAPPPPPEPPPATRSKAPAPDEGVKAPAADRPQIPLPSLKAVQSLQLPDWTWKAGAIAVGLLVLAVAVSWLSSDEEQAPAESSIARSDGDAALAGTGCGAIAGDWSWFTGGFVHFSADGRAFFKPTEDAPPALTATWECDEASGAYTVAWSHGFTETIKLYDNGQVVQGTNNVGVDVSGKRWVDPAAGMPPLQTTKVGSQVLPSNLPALARAARRVANDWRPDAYLVSLRIRKDGWPNKDAFYVEHSFYSPSEGTGLWVSTHLKRTRVREAGTVRWSTHELPERFIDLPKAVNTAKQAGMRGLMSRAQLSMERAGSGGSHLPVWNISPELHGEGVGYIDAVSGRLIQSRK